MEFSSQDSNGQLRMRSTLVLKWKTVSNQNMSKVPHCCLLRRVSSQPWGIIIIHFVWNYWHCKKISGNGWKGRNYWKLQLLHLLKIKFHLHYKKKKQNTQKSRLQLIKTQLIPQEISWLLSILSSLCKIMHHPVITGRYSTYPLLCHWSIFILTAL